MGRHDILSLTRQHNPLGYLTGRYWSPSAMWVIDLVVVLTGLGFVTAAVNAIIRVLFAMGRERVLPPSLARLSRRRTPAVAIGCVAVLALALGLPLTYAYGGARTFGDPLLGAAGLSVVLIYLAVNLSAIRAFRTGFLAQFRVWRHLVIPAAAAVFFLFPLWGILHPRGRALMDLLPFTALGWLGLGFIAARVLRARRPPCFEALGRVFLPSTTTTGCPGTLMGPANRRNHPRQGDDIAGWLAGWIREFGDSYRCASGRGAWPHGGCPGRRNVRAPWLA